MNVPEPMTDSTYPTRAVLGLYDRPMWDSIQRRAMALQCCKACGKYQYPPAPACAACLSSELEWRTLSGRGTILSWVIFHKTYLEDYPAPYNVVAVRLEEGPVIVSNLEGPPPQGKNASIDERNTEGSSDSGHGECNWIGTPVRLTYVTVENQAILPRVICDI
jgi:uncharacterized OB-fold protein